MSSRINAVTLPLSMLRLFSLRSLNRAVYVEGNCFLRRVPHIGKFICVDVRPEKYPQHQCFFAL